MTTSEAPGTPATNFDPNEQVLEEGRSESPENLPRGIGVASCFTEHMWYFAIAGDQLKRGAMVGKTMLGKMVLVGRKSDGQVFAMEDICPHQAVPLSAGCFDGKEVACCFHGWRFDSTGACTAIPSLVDGQKANLCGIRTKSYPCREEQGSVWVYFGDKPDKPPDVPRAFGVEDLSRFEKTTTTLILSNHIDYNAVALIDTAHVPYVHKSWWWRNSRSLKEKVKHYVPDQTGFTIVKHKPSKHSVYKYIGNMIEDEIGFRLPACRIERLMHGEKTLLSGITALTPIDENTTELNHTTYWVKTIPGIAPLVIPIVQYFVRTFLGQDKVMADLQKKCIPHNPKLVMTIRDAGTPGRWYFELKKAWNEAARTDRPFQNPVKPSFLKWKS